MASGPTSRSRRWGCLKTSMFCNGTELRRHDKWQRDVVLRDMRARIVEDLHAVRQNSRVCAGLSHCSGQRLSAVPGILPHVIPFPQRLLVVAILKSDSRPFGIAVPETCTRFSNLLLRT